jgi:hypothetical protein
VYSIRQIGGLLEVISQTQAVIIGGQAINLWSERYQKEEPPWLALRPYTSIDVDLLGNQSDARICAQGTKGELELPDDPAHTPNIAKVRCRNPAIDIDILHTVNGLSTAEALQTAVSLRHGNVQLRVLHPILCIESKTVNLITLDQQVEGRQDEKHLLLAIANCREFLTELTRNDPQLQPLVHWAERLRTHANSQLGLDVQRKHHIEFLQGVPVDLWLQTPGVLQPWAQGEVPKWRAEVQQKIQDIEEIERWVEDLKRRAT